MKVIPDPRNVQPNSDDKIKDHHNQQEDRSADRSNRHQREQVEVEVEGKDGENPNQPQIQNVTQQGENNTSGMKGEINTAFQEKTEEVVETVYQEEVPYQSKTVISPECRCWKDGSTTDKNKSVENGDSLQLQAKQSLDQTRRRDTRLQFDEHGHGNNLAEMKIQMRITRDHQHTAGHESETFESDRGVCKANRQKDNPGDGNGFIEKSQHKSMEECKNVAGKKPSIAKNHLLNPAKGKRHVSQNLEMQIQDEANATRCPGTPTQGNGLVPIFQELPHETNDGHQSEDTEWQPQGDEVPQVDHRPRKQKRALGKTQRILAKLLKEGKAARDVTIITGVFLLCYLPVWVLVCYGTFGGQTSAKAILSVHCIHAATTVWNPIIYSIRKKQFRKAARKLLTI